jgi:hypothetical protein
MRSRTASITSLPSSRSRLSRQRRLPAGFIEPCLPTKADAPPSGGLWLHEIKQDGHRLMARLTTLGLAEEIVGGCKPAKVGAQSLDPRR